MANKDKGEVGFESGGKPYMLHYSAEAIAQLEDALDMVFDEIGEHMRSKKFRFSQLRIIFWAGMIDRQPEFEKPDDIKPVLKELLPMAALELVGKAIMLATGSAEAKPPGPPQPEAAAPAAAPAEQLVPESPVAAG